MRAPPPPQGGVFDMNPYICVGSVQVYEQPASHRTVVIFTLSKVGGFDQEVSPAEGFDEGNVKSLVLLSGRGR